MLPGARFIIELDNARFESVNDYAREETTGFKLVLSMFNCPQFYLFKFVFREKSLYLFESHLGHLVNVHEMDVQLALHHSN